MHMAEVWLIEHDVPRDQLLCDQSVDVAGDIAEDALSGDGTCQLLCQVRLPRCPVVDSIERNPGVICSQIELGRKYVE